MSASSGFQAEPDRIRGHAATVTGLAGELSSVAGGVPGGLDANALGSFVRFLSAGLGSAVAKTGDSLGQAASAVHAIGSALARAADGYERIDRDHAGRLRQEAGL